MISVSVGALLQHLLFLVLAVVAPLWDFYDTSRLKKNPSLAGKLRYYKTLAAWLWIASAIAVVTVGFRTLTTINPAPDEISWLLQHAWVGHLAEALIAIILVVLLLLPLTIVIWKKLTKQPRRYRSADALKSFDYFFPATWTERRWVCFSLHHRRNLRRGFVPRLSVAVPTCLRFFAESDARAAYLLDHLWT
jgi:hypothetical protein